MRTKSGHIIKNFREQARLSRNELSRLSGVAETTLREMEGNKYGTDPEKANKIASVLSRFVDLSYIAGLFDKGSTIGISIQNTQYLNNRSSQNTGYSKNPYYYPRVQFYSKHKLLLEILQKVFEVGTFSYSKKTGMYTYMAWSGNAEIVLEKLLPYLRIKRKQAELCLELRQIQNYNRYLRPNRIKSCTKNPGGRTGFSTVEVNPLPEGTIKRMEDIYLEVRHLNSGKSKKELKESLEIIKSKK